MKVKGSPEKPELSRMVQQQQQQHVFLLFLQNHLLLFDFGGDAASCREALTLSAHFPPVTA